MKSDRSSVKTKNDGALDYLFPQVVLVIGFCVDAPLARLDYCPASGRQAFISPYFVDDIACIAWRRCDHLPNPVLVKPSAMGSIRFKHHEWQSGEREHGRLELWRDVRLPDFACQVRLRLARCRPTQFTNRRPKTTFVGTSTARSVCHIVKIVVLVATGNI